MRSYSTNTTAVPWWNVEEYWEYLLLVNPDKRIYNKVWEVKNDFSNNYGNDATITDPHITACVFLCKKGQELELINEIQTICNSIKASTIILDNYNGFGRGGIYIKIQNHQPFKQLRNRLTAINPFLQFYGYPPARFPKNPHMTLARGLTDKTYYNALYEYKQKPFFDSFMMNELVLVKRLYDHQKCYTVNTFSLIPNEGPKGPISYQLKFDL